MSYRTKPFQLSKLCVGVSLALPLAVVSGPAAAFNFQAGEWDGSLRTTVSVGSSWRTEDPNQSLYNADDADRVGESGGTGGKVDSGNLNYEKGDRFSTVGQFFTELSMEKGYMGGVVSLKGWYDQALEDEGVRQGNIASGYAQGKPLSDKGFENLQKYSGVQLLDAFVYNTWDINYHPVQVRLGRQVVNWGESLFIQGVNQGINPIDVPGFRRPGTELREVLLPTNMLYTNVGLGGGVSLEAYYQFEWDNSPVEGCGHYWAVTETIISSDPGGCIMGATVGPGDVAENLENRTYYPLVEGNDAKDSGQWGLALRLPVDSIGAELGLYAMNYHSKFPYLSLDTGAGPGSAPGSVLPFQANADAAGVESAAAFWEYPENIKLYGVSFASNIASWSVGAEVSHSPNFPVQLNGGDIVVGALTGQGPLGTTLATSSANTKINGYDRYEKTQFQINGINLWSNTMGAQTAVLIAEMGMQYGELPESDTERRYGRGFVYGFAEHEDGFGGSDPCAIGVNASPAGCKNDGFVTDFSWGYRVRGSLQYQNPFGLGMVVEPSLFVAHDVKGYSLDGQFQEGRISTTLAGKFTYLKRHVVDLSYVGFVNSADYNPLADRDYASVSYSYTF